MVKNGVWHCDRAITHLGGSNGFSATYVNGCKEAAGDGTPTFDAAGNMLTSGLTSGGWGQTTTFDVAGRHKSVSTVSRRRVGIYAMANFENVITQVFDGDGHASGYGFLIITKISVLSRR